jgi:hypothetical protein
MMANLLIALASVGLFLYWFRYTCRLILTARTSEDYSGAVARANELHFAEVQHRLSATARHQMDELLDRLEHDYRLLNYLYTHALDLRGSHAAIERRMLMVDFQLMKACYALYRVHSENRARAALWEMSLIVAHFANSMGEQLAAA